MYLCFVALVSWCHEKILNRLFPLKSILVSIVLIGAVGANPVLCQTESATPGSKTAPSAAKPSNAGVKLPVVFPPIDKSRAQGGSPSEEDLRARAERGDVDAMEDLGDLLPVPKDFPWYLKAAPFCAPLGGCHVSESGRNQHQR